MLEQQFAVAVAAARFPKRLDEIASTIWQAHRAGALSDDAAQAAAEAVQARRATIAALAHTKPVLAARRPPKPHPRSPDRQKSLERRRRMAASGALPPQIAANFTTGEQAALAVIAVEVEQSGRCDFPIDRIAALAGVCRSTVQNALREASRLGLLHARERRRPGQPNLSNVITITSSTWASWLKTRGGIGFKKTSASYSPTYQNCETDKKKGLSGRWAVQNRFLIHSRSG